MVIYMHIDTHMIYEISCRMLHYYTYNKTSLLMSADFGMEEWKLYDLYVRLKQTNKTPQELEIDRLCKNWLILNHSYSRKKY